MQRFSLNFNKIPSGSTCLLHKSAKKAQYLDREPLLSCYSGTPRLLLYTKERTCYDKAELFLFQVIESSRLILGGIHLHTNESFSNLIELYEAWGKPEESKKWRAKLTQMEDFEE